MKKFKKEDLQFEYHTAQQFESGFAIEEEVNFIPMYRHSQAMGIEAEEMCGTVVAVRFTKAKVFYDIVDDYYGKVFDNVDSVKVFKTKRNLPLNQISPIQN